MFGWKINIHTVYTSQRASDTNSFSFLGCAACVHKENNENRLYFILFYFHKNLDNLKDVHVQREAIPKTRQYSQCNNSKENNNILDNVYQIDDINSIIKIYLQP